MSSGMRRYFAGNSLEQALVLAARHFQQEPDRLAYRLVEKRHGFIRFPRRVVIEVDPASPLKTDAPAAVEAAPRAPTPAVARPPRAAEARPAPAPAGTGERERSAERPAAPPAPPRQEPPRPAQPRPAPPAHQPAGERAIQAVAASPEELLVQGRSALDAILRLAGLELEPAVRLEDGILWVNLSGPDRELLLDDEAELLQAIEYLLRRTMVHTGGVHGEGEGLQCRVDTDGFREGREEELRRLALDTAAAVRASRQPVLLEPMSPAERRIVHLALAEEPGVSTESEGEGYFKRVAIQPT